MLELFRAFQKLGNQMYIWSGCGIDYAENWRTKLGLTAVVVEKGNFVPDIAVDDQEVTLGKVNIKV